MTDRDIFLDRLRLRHLRLLVLIDQHKSLRSIAEGLNLSQPALSQMVKDLEHAFGTALVRRSARGVSLTPAGRLAMDRARTGLATFDHLARELQRDETPILRIGTNPAMLLHVIPRALRIMNTGTAPLRFHIRADMESVMTRALQEGQIDCYLGVVDWHDDQALHSDVLRHEPMVRTSELTLVCSAGHPLAGRNVTAEELLNWPWALQQVGSNNRLRVEMAFRRLGLAPPVETVMMQADPNAFMQLITQVDLIAPVPAMAIGPYLRNEAVVPVTPPELSFAPQSLDFVTLAQNSDTEPVRIFRQTLRQCFDSDGPGWTG